MSSSHASQHQSTHAKAQQAQTFYVNQKEKAFGLSDIVQSVQYPLPLSQQHTLVQQDDINF